MLFNAAMTYPEAIKIFFTAVEGKSKEEIASIKEEFNKVLPNITEKELGGAPAMTSYKIN